MGGHLTWGGIGRVKGIVSYSLSPFEQRAFAGVVSKGMANMFRRVSGNVLDIVPPFVLLYGIMSYAAKEHHEMHRKNPADFAHEEVK